jgi:hypothetical protein
MPHLPQAAQCPRRCRFMALDHPMLLERILFTLFLSRSAALAAVPVARGQLTTGATHICPTSVPGQYREEVLVRLQGDCFWQPADHSKAVVVDGGVGDLAGPPALIAPAANGPGVPYYTSPSGNSCSLRSARDNAVHGGYHDQITI